MSLAITGLGVVVLLAVLRQPAGPVIAPVIVQGQGNQVPRAEPEPEPAKAVVSTPQMPGEVCLEDGVFRPTGELRRGRKAVRARAFRAGDLFPRLPGYVAGAWVRE